MMASILNLGALTLLGLGVGYWIAPAAQTPSAQSALERPNPLEAELREPIFCAVLEGLFHDGVSNEVVDRMLETDPTTKYPANFVWACPICMPVINALDVYRARPKFRGDKMQSDSFGAGLAPEVEAAILRGDVAQRQLAIQALVEGWIRTAFDARRLTPAERERFQLLMDEGRKVGMERLESYRPLGGIYGTMKKCPSCEAGNGACRRQ